MRSELWLSLCLCMLEVALALPLSAAVIPGGVSSTSNIWGAGHASAPGVNSGSLPPVISFALGSVSWVRIDSLTGTVDCSTSSVAPYCAPVGADGGVNTGPLTGTNFSAIGGLSGIEFDGRNMFLIGVFLDGTEPTGTAPATLVYTNISANALSFSPLLKQLFFIGDGLDAAGANQRFMVPTGATRLALGFADGTPFLGAPGAPTTPGGYTDNAGFLTLNYTLMIDNPEPGSALLAGLGIAVLALLRRRRA